MPNIENQPVPVRLSRPPPQLEYLLLDQVNYRGEPVPRSPLILLLLMVWVKNIVEQHSEKHLDRWRVSLYLSPTLNTFTKGGSGRDSSKKLKVRFAVSGIEEWPKAD
jgi:hypothetical protein